MLIVLGDARSVYLLMLPGAGVDWEGSGEMGG